MTDPGLDLDPQAVQDRRALSEALRWARKALACLARTAPLDERARSSLKAITLAMGPSSPRIRGALARAEEEAS